jgi:hypothetical protein
VAPRNDFDPEERKTPSKRNWQRRPERGDDQPRGPKRPKPRRPDDVVWDWEETDAELEDEDDVLPGDDALDEDFEDQDYADEGYADEDDDR